MRMNRTNRTSIRNAIVAAIAVCLLFSAWNAIGQEQQVEQRPLVVHFSPDWFECQWCGVVDDYVDRLPATERKVKLSYADVKRLGVNSFPTTVVIRGDSGVVIVGGGQQQLREIRREVEK